MPSKRPAPAQAKPSTTTRATLGESSSTSHMAVEPASPPKKSAWAPIPKVVPPPPPPPSAPIVDHQQQSSSSSTTETHAVKEEESVSVQQQQQQRPIESAPVVPSPKQRKQTHTTEPAKSVSDKATKPVAIEKKPALPAAAAWGKGTTSTGTGTGSMASSLENSTITTPVNFGPSLSDALSAPQKPKHSPTIPRKKEKKLKSKMVRLEEFEEGLKNNTNGTKASVAATATAGNKGKAAVTSGGGTSALSTQLRRSGESAWQQVPKPTPVVIAPTKSTETPQQQQPAPKEQPQQKQKQKKQPATATASVKPKEEPVAEKIVEPEQVDDGQPKEQDVTMAEPVQEQQQPFMDQKDEDLEIRKEQEDQQEMQHDEQQQQQPVVSLQKPEAKPEEEEEMVVEQVDNHAEDNVEPTNVKESPPSPEFSVQVQPSFTSYVLGDLIVDDVNQQDEHDSMDDEGGLSSLKADLASEDDEGRLYDHISRSEKVQQDELGGTSPLGALDHGMIQQSPERPPLLDEQLDHVHFHTVHQLQQHGPSPTLLDDLRMPMEQHGSGRAHGPPPGFSGPPEWQSHHFDPFNGQDPAAARRLQHSQQMLEASGLFPGFGRPPPPPPPSLFDFHGNTPPPPPGMFGLPQPMLRQPPPHHHQPPPPPHPHRHPDFMNMPPGLGPMGPQHHPPPQQQQQQSPMENHHHDMMHLENNMQRLSMHQQHPPPMAEHREDPLRSMQDDLRALLPNVNISFSPMRDEDPSHKPHTPGIEDRRPSDLSNNTPVLQHESDQQQHDKILATLTNGSTVHKPDAYPEEEEEKDKEHVGKDSDVKQEAQNFFGEFLRKAAASTPHLMNGQHYKGK